MKIVVDAMGGDYAPETIIEGAVRAVNEFNVEVVLVGDEKRINLLLKKQRYSPDRIQIYPSSEVIGMSESPVTGVRKKKNSSIVLGIDLVKKGIGQAFFSAGNTGAVVCASTLKLGTLSGIERSGIAIHVPTLKGFSIVIDVGANINPKPVQLLQYGIMADAYFRYIFNKDNPGVGLLNVGEEESKGTEFVKETHSLMSKSNLNFMGNVEGKDLFSGKCDIIVCDGFVGNIALKVSESFAESITKFLKRSLKYNPVGLLGLGFLSLGLSRFRKQIDYSEYGGAPLLGINGVVIIGHGRSGAKAVKNAIRVAKQEVALNVNDKIVEAIKNI
jgi:glycerol-3-phosphate acyltransferase PlsX